jgi:hypothetical protein
MIVLPMRRLAVVALLAVTPWPAAGASSAPAEGPDRLTAAFLRGDRDGLASAAQRAGNRGLAAALASSDPARSRAAIAAAASVTDAWALLEPLATLAARRDRAQAAPAARAAAAIARALDPLTVADDDVPSDELAARLAAWRDVAELAGLWPDVRVHALETAAALYRALGERGEAPFQLAAMLADPEPELRCAALELLPRPLPSELRAQVAERVTVDPDNDAALCAAQAVCAELELDASAAPALAALGEAGLARVRELLLDPDARAGAVADAARCLAADGSAPSVAALRALARGGPEPLRDALRELLAGRR